MSGAAVTRVVGLHHGRELDVRGTLQLQDGALVFTDGRERAMLRIPLDTIDGWQESPGRVTLYLADGDVLDVDTAGDETRALLRAALDAACRPPEFARSLRALGAAADGEQAAHDRWFGPLLRARRSLEGVSDPLRQGALLDADALAVELDRALEELAAARIGEPGARRRALVAALEEETLGVRAALARVALSGVTLQGSAPDSRLADWRAWVEGVRGLFRAFDAAWPAVARTLRDGA